MTDLAAPAAVDMGRPPTRTLPRLLGGLLGGVALGVVARGWMRFISDDPEFSWAGTVFIVVAFALFGLAQAVVAVVRARARTRRAVTAARIGGTVGMLPLFAGAGAVMLPTVVGAGLARYRTRWPWPARALCALLATGPVTYVISELVGSFGWSLRTLAGVAAFLGIYATVVWAARGTFQPSPGVAPRWVRWAWTAVAGLLALRVVLVLVLS